MAEKKGKKRFIPVGARDRETARIDQETHSRRAMLGKFGKFAGAAVFSHFLPVGSLSGAINPKVVIDLCRPGTSTPEDKCTAETQPIGTPGNTPDICNCSLDKKIKDYCQCTQQDWGVRDECLCDSDQGIADVCETNDARVDHCKCDADQGIADYCQCKTEATGDVCKCDTDQGVADFCECDIDLNHADHCQCGADAGYADWCKCGYGDTNEADTCNCKNDQEGADYCEVEYDYGDICECSDDDAVADVCECGEDKGTEDYCTCSDSSTSSDYCDCSNDQGEADSEKADYCYSNEPQRLDFCDDNSKGTGDDLDVCACRRDNGIKDICSTGSETSPYADICDSDMEADVCDGDQANQRVDYCSTEPSSQDVCTCEADQQGADVCTCPDSNQEYDVCNCSTDEHVADYCDPDDNADQCAESDGNPGDPSDACDCSSDQHEVDICTCKEDLNDLDKCDCAESDNGVADFCECGTDTGIADVCGEEYSDGAKHQVTNPSGDYCSCGNDTGSSDVCNCSWDNNGGDGPADICTEGAGSNASADYCACCYDTEGNTHQGKNGGDYCTDGNAKPSARKDGTPSVSVDWCDPGSFNEPTSGGALMDVCSCGDDNPGFGDGVITGADVCRTSNNSASDYCTVLPGLGDNTPDAIN